MCEFIDRCFETRKDDVKLPIGYIDKATNRVKNQITKNFYFLEHQYKSLSRFCRFENKYERSLTFIGIFDSIGHFMW